MKKYTLVPVVFLLLVLNSCSLFYIEEEEMPYIPTEDEIELTASVEEDADYYIFTTRVDYLNSKVNSGGIVYYLEFNTISSVNYDNIMIFAREGTASIDESIGSIYYENQIIDSDLNFEMFNLNTKNTRSVPGKDRDSLYAYSSDYDPRSSYRKEETGEIISREYPFVYTKYWIPKNQDFRLDTLAIVIEHRDYTGSSSTKSVYKEIPFVHTLEGTAE